MHDIATAYTVAEPSPPPFTLRDKIAQWVRLQDGKNGFHLLKTGGDALAARLAAIQAAEESLDLQYYMLQDDLTGRLVIEELLRAADRGVRIRILLDDLDIGRAQEAIGILALHDNIECRVFNPADTRKERWIFRISKWSRTFERYTKRMHNKMIIADDCFGVVGGRNLGDEYFDAAEDFAFSDLDVLVMGPVLKRLNSCFEAYWRSKPVFAVDSIYSLPDEKHYRVQRIALRRYYDDVAHMKVISKAKPQDYLEMMERDALALAWADAEFCNDHPEKVLQSLEESKSPPMECLERLLDKAEREFVAVSPYFIPGKDGLERMRRLLTRGVKIRILTNSLASTDISAVHAVYSRYRTRLLQEGAEIYELCPIPGKRSRSNLFPRRGVSRSSLHAKTYIIDREYVIIGSMNLDPRSRYRNTETIIALRSKEMAKEILEMFREITAPERSYRLKLGEDGKPRWLAVKKGRKKLYSHEPCPGLLRRFLTKIFYYIAPENQL